MYAISFCITCGQITENNLWCEFCNKKIRVNGRTHLSSHQRISGGRAASQQLDGHMGSLQHDYLFHWGSENGRFCSRTCRKLKNKNSVEFLLPLACELLSLKAQKKTQRRVVLVPSPPRQGVIEDHAWSWAMALHGAGCGEVRTLLRRASDRQQKDLSRQERSGNALERLAGVRVDPAAEYVFVDDVLTSGATALAAYHCLNRPQNFSICTIFHRALLR